MIEITRGQVDIRILIDCRLCYFLVFFGRHYSSSLLVLMSLEKCFAVYFPLKSKIICTVKTAKWATSIVGVILAGYNSVYFFAYRSDCFNSFEPAVIKYLDYVNSSLYSFGPFILMFLTNFAIVLKFMRAKCKSILQNPPIRLLLNLPPGGQLWSSLFLLHF